MPAPAVRAGAARGAPAAVVVVAVGPAVRRAGAAATADPGAAAVVERGGLKAVTRSG